MKQVKPLVKAVDVVIDQPARMDCTCPRCEKSITKHHSIRERALLGLNHKRYLLTMHRHYCFVCRKHFTMIPDAAMGLINAKAKCPFTLPFRQETMDRFDQTGDARSVPAICRSMERDHGWRLGHNTMRDWITKREAYLAEPEWAAYFLTM